MSTAHIQSPGILKKFREQFVKFASESQQALASVNGDVSRVSDWLRREQGAYWKAELRRREDLVQQARLEYLRAIQGDKVHAKVSGVDERKLLERAQRRKREAEEKIELVKRWSWTIDQKAGKLLQPCSSFATLLDQMTPQALGSLDRMLDHLDEYLRPSDAPPPSGGKP